MVTQLGNRASQQRHISEYTQSLEEPSIEHDPARVMRGVSLGVLLSLPVWALIGWAVWALA